MKNLFLLAGLMLCFVLVQAMRVVEPPGKDQSSVCPVVCQADIMEYQAIDIADVAGYEMPLSFIPFAACFAIENAELCYEELLPGMTSQDLLFWKFNNDFIAVARSGVLMNTDFLSMYTESLTNLNLNFDGNHDRFY